MKGVLTLFTIVALSVLMSIHLMPDKVSLEVGDLSPREIRAGRSVISVNTFATQRLQEAARLATPAVYDLDENATSEALRTVREYFDTAESRRITLPNSREAKPEVITQLSNQLHGAFTPTQIRRLLTLPSGEFQKLRESTITLVSEAMAREIRDRSGEAVPSGDLSAARQTLATAAKTRLPSSEDAAIATVIASQALRVNRLLNISKTFEARDGAARHIKPVYESVARGDKILSPGEKVTQEHLDKLTALGLRNPHLDVTTGAAICVLAAAMALLVGYYIKRSLPALYADNRRLALLSVIVLLSVFGLKAGASMLGLSFSSGQLGFLGLMSVAAAGMLVSVLLDLHLAVLIVALLSVQSGLIMNHEIRFTVMTLMSSLVGIGAAGTARRKINLLRVTAALSVANLALVWLLGLLLRDSFPELLTGSAWAVGSAVFATFLFWFGVLALERPFGILTHTALLEMAAAEQPLLKKLCAVAPGTYAHSIMVGTLSEAGAQAVEADALLCRVGGYYHDIGKIKHPDFFVENQRNENVHGRLSPSLSALIIQAHVRDGVTMARENKLPDEIRDIIAQHHGTTLISYFYHRALTDCSDSGEIPPGLEERFRYPGPKPQTRESAIVMLADSVEAAARCLPNPSQEKLEAMVDKIARDKIEDGQFDACPMTFADVKKVSNAFVHVLTAMMHGRIDYPEPLTATGQPMEVVRPDLRPETVSHSLPRREETATVETLYLSDGGGATGLDDETAPTGRESFTGLTLSLPLPSAMDLERINLEERSPLDGEVPNADTDSEHAISPGPRDSVAASPAPPASRRRHGSRRGQRASHG